MREKLTYTLLVCLCIISTSCVALNSIPYPIRKIGTPLLPPGIVPYFLSHFPIDSTTRDLCKPEDIKFNATSVTSCFDYFCSCTTNPSVCISLTPNLIYNEMFAKQFVDAFNYCLFCSNNASNYLRDVYNTSSECKANLPPIEKIQHVSFSHCNRYTTNTNYTAIIDEKFYTNSSWHTKKLLSINNQTHHDNTLRYFENLFTDEDISNPFFCYCSDYKMQPISFVCGDVYHSFFVPLKRLVLPMFILIIIPILWIVDTLIILVPFCHKKTRNIRNKLERATTMKKNYVHVLDEYCFMDITLVIVVVKNISLFFLYMENLGNWMCNFESINMGYDLGYWGIGRAFCAFSTSVYVCFLSIQWSHYIDQLKALESTQRISKFNIGMMSIVLGMIALFLVVGGITGISLVDKSNTIFFVSASVCMVVLPTTMLVSFSIYGIVISKKMNFKTADILSYRYTRFIVIFNIVLAVVFIIAGSNILTLLISHDVFSVFYSNFKDSCIDLTLISVTIPVTYILFKKR